MEVAYRSETYFRPGTEELRGYFLSAILMPPLEGMTFIGLNTRLAQVQ
jgi:hypothetical protein